MQITKVISTRIGSATSRLVKILRFGKSDVQEPRQSSAFGIDSNPVPKLLAVYSETSENGKAVILGYININQLADIGECRIYSTDENNSLKAYLWAKNDGDLLVNGDTDNLIRYLKLNQGLQQFVNDLKLELTAIQAGIIAGGGTYTPNPAFHLDISDSKIDNVKTN